MENASRFDTPSEYAAALDTLLSSAQYLIRIYDWDLADGGYEAPARIELLSQFCKQGSGRQLRILLADGVWLKSHGGQMMRLLATWGHVLSVRVRDSEPPPAHDCFALADDKSVLKRFDKNQAKGILRLDSRGDTVDPGIRFDGEWGRASGRVSARTLGL